MKRYQYDQFRHDFDPKTATLSMIVTTGRAAQKIGSVLRFAHNQVVLDFDGGEQRKFHYTKVEEIDAEGKTLIRPVMDTTGREIKEGAVICYSVPAGSSSHGMEIGRVQKLSPTGQVTTRVLIYNGERLDPNRWGMRTSTITDPDRAILLPIDDTMVMLWILSDFEVFKEGALLE